MADRLDAADGLLAKYQQFPPQAANDILFNAARVRALLAAKRGNLDAAIQESLVAEQIADKLFVNADARRWLSKLPRATWLAQRNLAADSVQSRQLAGEILANVSLVQNPDAPAVGQLKKLHALP